MKYKVILYNAGSQPQIRTEGFTFYTLSQAVSCVTAWTALSDDYKGYMWDGSNWRTYD